MIGNPTEVVLVRMCADGVKSQGQRYLYPNAISGMIRIGSEEGLKTFTKGLAPNVVRSVLMSKSSHHWSDAFELTNCRCFTDRGVSHVEMHCIGSHS